MSRKTFTTTQVAKIAEVSPNTVKKWVDRGLMGFRMPGSEHRRIGREELIAFLVRNRLPVDNALMRE